MTEFQLKSPQNKESETQSHTFHLISEILLRNSFSEALSAARPSPGAMSHFHHLGGITMEI